MARWLFKIEPDCYSFDDLEREGETAWDGVANPLARKNLRSAAVGDEVFLYYTGDAKVIVGVMQVSAAAEAGDTPTDVRVKPVRRLAHPVSLAAIKADPAFADWELVQQARLSVMPVPDALWRRVEQMAAGGPEKPMGKRK